MERIMNYISYVNLNIRKYLTYKKMTHFDKCPNCGHRLRVNPVDAMVKDANSGQKQEVKQQINTVVSVSKLR